MVKKTKMLDGLLHRCSLICVSLMLVCRIQGKVITQKTVTASLNQPLTIRCNLTLSREESLRQIRWENRRNETVIIYTQDDPPEPDTTARQYISVAQPDASAITFNPLTANDAGCYKCIFNVYPTGTVRGETCITVTDVVKAEKNKTAIGGKMVKFKCTYGITQHVQQVLWKKINATGTWDIISYSKLGNVHPREGFRDRFTISRGLEETTLHIASVKPEDEACYSCQFHTYPEGTKKDISCLTVFVLPKPHINYKTTQPGVIEANCTAVGRPAPEILWNVEEDNRTLNTATFTEDRGDGTTQVIGTISVKASLLDDKSVKCIVHHRGLDSPIGVSMNTKIGKALTILITVTVVAVLLVMCLCVCLWRCFIRKDDD
ncbi:OX-2 membrane glycoprotein isoform X2 [Amia ocellicauda]|uniref:OX-2 membrane glycoprotein isoform X2 n=1 Tax=Amia ocellicauda TaxID=2972642 RepID=UPI003463BA8F